MKLISCYQKAMKASVHLHLMLLSNEHVREKTNNLGSDQARHKPGCTAAEDG